MRKLTMPLTERKRFGVYDPKRYSEVQLRYCVALMDPEGEIYVETFESEPGPNVYFENPVVDRYWGVYLRYKCRGQVDHVCDCVLKDQADLVVAGLELLLKGEK